VIELRHNTEQIIKVGVLLTKQLKMTDPLDPIYGAQLSWYYWRYLIKSDGTTVDILNHTWSDIPNCAGCYFLTVTETDTNQLGSLIVYIYDAASLGKPIFMEFEVISQNVWDSKYSANDFLITESQHAQKG